MVHNILTSTGVFADDAERSRAKRLATEDYKLKYELVKIREAKGYTVSDIADMLGISVENVHEFEHYDSDPRQSTVRMYAHAIGVVITHNVIENYVED